MVIQTPHITKMEKITPKHYDKTSENQKGRNQSEKQQEEGNNKMIYFPPRNDSEHNN